MNRFPTQQNYAPYHRSDGDHHPLFSDFSEHDNLGYQYFGGGRQNYAGLESGSGELAMDDAHPDTYFAFIDEQNPLSRLEGHIQPIEPQRTYRGLGPKNYRRPDHRIHEDVCQQLAADPHVDVSEISVDVNEGIVTLEGTAAGRPEKYRIEDIVEACRGVQKIHNRVMVEQRLRPTGKLSEGE